MKKLIICAWCGVAVEPGAARYRLFWSPSIRAVTLRPDHYHPKCGDELRAFCDERRQRVTLETMAPIFGDPAYFQPPPRKRRSPP